MAEKLKLCPFCGGEAMLLGTTIHWVVCSKCSVETYGYHDIEGAIDAWNSRVSDSDEADDCSS